MASLATPRVSLCLVDTPTGLYAMGGRCGDQAVSLVERYDPEKDTWMATHSMNKARCHFGAVSANGVLYAINGMKKNTCIHKTTEMLDPRIVPPPLPFCPPSRTIPLPVGDLESRFKQTCKRPNGLQLSLSQQLNLRPGWNLAPEGLCSEPRKHHPDF